MADEQKVLESIQKCFDGVSLYAAQRAAAGDSTSEIREFALDMVSFWGLDNENPDKYEAEFDRAVTEAAASGRAPEITEQVKADVEAGFQNYLVELECVGGRDIIYRRCEAFTEKVRAAWGIGNEETLMRRLDERLLNRFQSVSQSGTTPDIEAIRELGRYIDMYGYLTEEHNFEESEVERLLRFEDPLEVAVECVNLGGDIRTVDLNFYLNRMNAEKIFPILPDSDTPPQERETDPKKDTERKRTARKGKER